MIIVTGGIGFIGSNLVRRLNKIGIVDILIVDNTLNFTKLQNLNGLKYSKIIKPNELSDIHFKDVKIVYHLGARTNTMEESFNEIVFLNMIFSEKLMRLCVKYDALFIYASSAATYGNGELGYDDNIHASKLLPLNLYGHTKNSFDNLMLSDNIEKPKHWYGFKFFNVYGQGESHKNRMASVVYHGFKQLKADGVIKLFKSNDESILDGEQRRDFIYVNDVVKTLIWFGVYKPDECGIYNLGTGMARSFNDLANSLIKIMGGRIEYIKMPENLNNKYQNFTESNVLKLKNTMKFVEFTTLEDGISEYVNYLK